MRPLRSILVCAVTVSLLGFPGAATAANAPTAGSQPTDSPVASQLAGRRDTSIRYLDFDHTRTYGSRSVVRGQVAAWVRGEHRALQGVHVRLYRKVSGTHSWNFLASRRTSETSRPQFRFGVTSIANSTYKVVFGGNRAYRGARNTTVVLVHRALSPRMEDRTGAFHGRVTPRYPHRFVHLEKRACATCSWQRVRSNRTGDYGVWRFVVNAPASGRWWWRASTPASQRFIWSYSGVYTTEVS